MELKQKINDFYKIKKDDNKKNDRTIIYLLY